MLNVGEPLAGFSHAEPWNPGPHACSVTLSVQSHITPRYIDVKCSGRLVFLFQSFITLKLNGLIYIISVYKSIT